MFKKIVFAATLTAVSATSALATSGGLDRNGCHMDHQGNAGYHCHRSSSNNSGALEGGDALLGIAGMLLLFGAVNQAIVNNGQPQYHQPQPNPQTCGWTEQRVDGGDRWIYYRYDGCQGTLIGERWEKKFR